MFAKITTGSLAAGLINYMDNVKEKDARILIAKGLCAVSHEAICASFEIQASRNHSISEKMLHISLAFSENDGHRTKSDEFMTAFALDYLKRMGWDKTQLIIIRHDDHDYDHIHMALNVIGDDGKPLDLKFYKTRSQRTCFKMTKEYGLYFAKYKKNPSAFLAPKDFINIFPGIYMENSFGSGRVMNIYNSQFIVFYRSHEKLENGNDTTYLRSQGYMGGTAEVISNNNMSLKVAQSVKDMIAGGDMIVQSPAGFEVQIDFPIQEIIDRFKEGGNSNIGVVNDLTFEIPVYNITNDYGIKPPTYLLMVKTSEKDDFFATNHKTDSKTSFYATYDNSTRTYKFSGMRNFVLDILNNKGGIAEETDKHFTLTPVDLIAENTSTSGSSYYYYYYYGTSVSNTEVIGIRPALNKPSIARLDLDNAIIRFVFSTQSQRQ